MEMHPASCASVPSANRRVFDGQRALDAAVRDMPAEIADGETRLARAQRATQLIDALRHAQRRSASADRARRRTSPRWLEPQGDGEGTEPERERGRSDGSFGDRAQRDPERGARACARCAPRVPLSKGPRRARRRTATSCASSIAAAASGQASGWPDGSFSAAASLASAPFILAIQVKLCRARPGRAAGCTSCATSWPGSEKATRRWSPSAANGLPVPTTRR